MELGCRTPGKLPGWQATKLFLSRPSFCPQTPGSVVNVEKTLQRISRLAACVKSYINCMLTESGSLISKGQKGRPASSERIAKQTGEVAVHQNGREVNYCADITGCACVGERIVPKITLHLQTTLVYSEPWSVHYKSLFFSNLASVDDRSSRGF